MQYRTLGRTGIKVSPYALGALMFATQVGNPDPEDSIRIIHKALDAGINLVDTADAYGDSEEVRPRRRRDRQAVKITRLEQGCPACGLSPEDAAACSPPGAGGVPVARISLTRCWQHDSQRCAGACGAVRRRLTPRCAAAVGRQVDKPDYLL